MAYGRDGLGEETRNTLLYSQMQEGLKIKLMRDAAVSGAGSYQALCLAAKNEERRLAELRKRQQYRKATIPSAPPSSSSSTSRKAPARAMIRDEAGHFASACKNPKSESKGRHPSKRPDQRTKHSNLSSNSTKRVSSEASREGAEVQENDDPLEYLLSGSEDDDKAGVKKVQLEDAGSIPKCVSVLVEGVPATGLVDTGADLTIMRGELFKAVAVAAKLRKRDLHKANVTPKT